jgi:hypothetical protein
VLQQKTKRPVQFEITEPTRDADIEVNDVLEMPEQTEV